MEREELIPQIQTDLRERFAAPVTIRVEAGKVLEGKELFEAMDSMRSSLLQKIPAGGTPSGKKEEKAAPVFCT